MTQYTSEQLLYNDDNSFVYNPDDFNSDDNSFIYNSDDFNSNDNSSDESQHIVNERTFFQRYIRPIGVGLDKLLGIAVGAVTFTLQALPHFILSALTSIAIFIMFNIILSIATYDALHQVTKSRVAAFFLTPLLIPFFVLSITAITIYKNVNNALRLILAFLNGAVSGFKLGSQNTLTSFVNTIRSIPTRISFLYRRQQPIFEPNDTPPAQQWPLWEHRDTLFARLQTYDPLQNNTIEVMTAAEFKAFELTPSDMNSTAFDPTFGSRHAITKILSEREYSTLNDMGNSDPTVKALMTRYNEVKTYINTGECIIGKYTPEHNDKIVLVKQYRKNDVWLPVPNSSTIFEREYLRLLCCESITQQLTHPGHRDHLLPGKSSKYQLPVISLNPEIKAELYETRYKFHNCYRNKTNIKASTPTNQDDNIINQDLYYLTAELRTHMPKLTNEDVNCNAALSRIENPPSSKTYERVQSDTAANSSKPSTTQREATRNKAAAAALKRASATPSYTTGGRLVLMQPSIPVQQNADDNYEQLGLLNRQNHK